MTSVHAARDRRTSPLATRFRHAVLPCASVSWLAVVPLYAFDLRPLPEPAVALTIATLVAMIAAAVSAVMTELPRPAPHPRPTGPAGDAAYIGTRSVPAAAPTPAAVSPAAPRAVDPSAFAPAPRTQLQCPHCGGFATTAQGGPQAARARCETCGTAWTADPTQPPDVAVRSWLHQRRS